MCMDGFTLVNVTDSKNKTVEKCLYDFCGYEMRVVKSWNGISYCKPCNTSFCNECGIAKVGKSVFNEVNRTETIEVQETEICLKCHGGYILDELKGQCIDSYYYNTMRDTKYVDKDSKYVFK